MLSLHGWHCTLIIHEGEMPALVPSLSPDCGNYRPSYKPEIYNGDLLA